MTKYVADGYFKDGRSRPWRKVEVLEVSGRFAKVKYIDTGEIVPCPMHAISDVKK